MRIISPSKLGTAKGMLFVKEQIDKIQIPSSMIKVGKSKEKPLHDDVVLNIIRMFPSQNCEIFERLLNDSKKNPTNRQTKLLKLPPETVQNVLRAKGVSTDVLNRCKFPKFGAELGVLCF